MFSYSGFWVPGHSNVDGNERADHAAWTASHMSFIDPEPVFGISPRAVRTALRLWVTEQLSQKWQKEARCRQSKLLIPGPNLVRSRELNALSRSQLRTVIGLLTGHCPLNRHLNIMGVTADAICPLCLEREETSFHFLGECDALSRHRSSILGGRYLDAEDTATQSG